jgi:hypothetical protein
MKNAHQMGRKRATSYTFGTTLRDSSTRICVATAKPPGNPPDLFKMQIKMQIKIDLKAVQYIL